MKKLNALLICLALVVMGCANTVQTTSGEAYLKKYAQVPQRSGKSAGPGEFDIDAAIREAASVEPILEFPARIGLVRITHYGRISDIPEAEAEHWAALADRLGEGFGSFVPINPLIAKLTAAEAPNPNPHQLDVVSQIRLIAARQHLDAVLMYEVNTAREIEQNAMAATDFAIVTAFVLPSRKIKGEAIGTALLIDVIQGYPYGTVEARVQEQKLATLWGTNRKSEAIAARLRASVTAELVVETQTMFTELRSQLAEQRLKNYKTERSAVEAN